MCCVGPADLESKDKKPVLKDIITKGFVQGCINTIEKSFGERKVSLGTLTLLVAYYFYFVEKKHDKFYKIVQKKTQEFSNVFSKTFDCCHYNIESDFNSYTSDSEKRMLSYFEKADDKIAYNKKMAEIYMRMFKNQFDSSYLFIHYMFRLELLTEEQQKDLVQTEIAPVLEKYIHLFE